jgi:nucleotide-binding universal stress UspA family protein
MSDNTGPVVVGVDGSAQSLQAVELALEEAGLRGVPLHVVHCADITPAVLHLSGGVNVNTKDLADRQHQEVWELAAPVLDDTEVDVMKVELSGYPADELVRHAEDNDAVLVVVGTRGRGRVASAVLGSTSMRVLEHAPCPVLVAKKRV